MKTRIWRLCEERRGRLEDDSFIHEENNEDEAIPFGFCMRVNSFEFRFITISFIQHKTTQVRLFNSFTDGFVSNEFIFEKFISCSKSSLSLLYLLSVLLLTVSLSMPFLNRPTGLVVLLQTWSLVILVGDLTACSLALEDCFC